MGVEDPTRDLSATSGAVGSPAPRPRVLPLAPGDHIERFVVLDILGRGGMGVVVSAYDPTLDRRVAIKVLRPDRVAPGDGARRARLLREAQAMARLAHPNVVTVYEAGSIGDEVFVAMQFVGGETLHAWLAGGARPWREVLRRFVSAGHGLAAAHRAGLVHRDFKPENVLVAHDGTVRVADFGLVGVAPRAVTPDEVDGDALDEARLTRTGSILGTPAYMAPEQHRGEGTDARSDQFGFCVSLYEALYGVRPFGGRNRRELLEAIVASRISRPTHGADVPAWIARAVSRGLSADPAQRWPDMDSLLAALSREPGAARRRWIAGGATAAALVAAAVALAPRGARETCGGAQQKIAGLWDDAQRDAARAAFVATGKPHAAAAFAKVDAALRARLDAWRDAYGGACRDTRVLGTQSEVMLDRRMACLERSRRQLAALTALWSVDVDVDRAVTAALTTGDVRGCADGDALPPLPADPTTRAAVDAVRATLDEAVAQTGAGRIDDARKLAREAVTAARGAGHAPVFVEALRREGALECDNGKPDGGATLLHEAVGVAADSRDDAQLAAALRELVACLGVRAQKLREASGLYVAAEAAARRAGAPRRELAQLHLVRGSIAHLEARREEAVSEMERAVALLEADGGDELELARFLTNLTLAYDAAGRSDDALRAGDRALAMREARLGGDHALVANVITNLSVVASHKGDLELAARYDARALAIRERTLPAESAPVALSLHNLGQDYAALGRDDDARPLLERAASIRERLLGPDHPDLAMTLGALAELAFKRGDLAAARTTFERVVSMKAQAYGDEHPSVAHALTWLGHVYLDLGELRAARASFTRALAIRDRTDGDREPNTTDALNGLARVDLAERLFAAALPRLERSLRIVDATLGRDHRRRCVPLRLLEQAERGLGRPVSRAGDLAACEARAGTR